MKCRTFLSPRTRIGVAIAAILLFVSIPCATAESAWTDAAPGQTLAIHTPVMRLAIDAASGGLIELTALESGRNHIEPAAPPSPIWGIVFSDDEVLSPQHARVVKWRYADTEESSLELSWRGFTTSAELTVNVSVMLDPDKAVSRWRIKVAGLDGRCLGRVAFPRIVAIAPQEGETLAVPVWMGELTAASRRMVDNGRRLEWEYPGRLSLQCMTVYGMTGGLYLACTDTAGYWKKFAAVSGGGPGTLGLELVQLPESTSTAGYDAPYEATVGCFQGDWITAAQIYREWAVHQTWTVKSRLKSRQTPDWVRDTGIWVWNRQTSDHVLKPAAAMRAASGLPVSVLWHWWHGCPYDVGFPEYMPPREGAEPFITAMRDAHDAGIRALVYMNQRLWGMTTRSWNDEDAQRYAVKRSDGTVRAEVYNIFTGSPCASMCMGTSFWRTKYAGLAEQAILGLGVDGIYMDQACSSLACFDDSHGHPLGGGTYWMEGFRQLEEDIRNRTAGRDIALAGEGCGELWLPRLDLMLSLQVSMERYAAPGDWEPIPFFQSVYHDCAVQFGSYSSLAMPPYDPLWPKEFAPEVPEQLLDRKFSRQFKLEQARSFVWGQQPALANFTPNQLEDRKQEIDYFLRLARLRHENRKFLLYGTFLRPPAIEAPEAELDISRLSIYAGHRDHLKEYRKRYPLVVAGAWLAGASDGSIGVALASIADEILHVEFEPVSEWPIGKQGSVFQIDPNGRHLISKFDNGLDRIRVDLAANGACLIQIVSATDFADAAHRDAWLRHPVLGDPSFDAFTHSAKNPVFRGAAPYEWPVNGFLFADPVGGNWYCYVGHYCMNYQLSAETPSRCTVFRSSDKGATWEHVGPVFPDEPFYFQGELSPALTAPDVAVIYADGRYHMAYDWASANTTWANAANPPRDANSGVGYAWAEKPEGPFHREPRAIATTRDQVLLLGKYRRLYASSIIRRNTDWLVLTLTDSGPYFGWALLGMTAARPEGPYSAPTLLLHPETDRFHPPLLEFFPAFTHEGMVYSPATSVAMNRNFQTLFAAPIECADEPDAWTIIQLGSVWHAEPVEHEYFGIWGQTFSGFIHDGVFNVMYPSRDSRGYGTINLASRKWDTPYIDRGFVLSGHEGPSIALMKHTGPAETVEVEVECSGTASIIWNHAGPLGPNAPTANSAPHPMSLGSHAGVELSEGGWRIYEADRTGDRKTLENGEWESAARTVRVRLNADATELTGRAGERHLLRPPEWSPSSVLGLIVEKHSHARVSRFTVTGERAPARMSWLWTEALVGAAQNLADWNVRKDDAQFRYGTGVDSNKDGVAAKWNVECSRFWFWAPKSPEYGAGTVSIDGRVAGTIDFHAPEPVASSPIFDSGEIASGYHAIRLTPHSGRIPIDSLETQY